MNDNVKFKILVVENNGVLYIRIPTEIIEWINTKKGDTLTLMPDQNKYGKFAAFWNPEQQGTESDQK
jgi:hypothetical protein